MKNDLYQQVKAAQEEYRIASTKEEEIREQMYRELNKAETKIVGKYASILKKLREKKHETDRNLWNIARIYNAYSMFFTPMITDFFAAFLSYVEGEKYIPYREFEYTAINESGVIIKADISEQYRAMNYDVLDKLYQNGDLILLTEGFTNMVEFYDNVGEPNYKFGKYGYLKDFVNGLIQYRIDNEKKDIRSITMGDLYLFASDFLSEHPDLITRNKDKREKMLINQSEETISQCKKFELK